MSKENSSFFRVSVYYTDWMIGCISWRVGRDFDPHGLEF